MPGGERGKSSSGRKIGQPSVTWADDRLIRACLKGDQQAWSALIAKYKNLIYSIPVKYGANPQDASDIFQAVCIDLFNDLPRLRNTAGLRRWIITVAAHQSFHWKRKVQRRAEEDLDSLEEAELPADLPPDVLEEVEREQVLREAIAQLPERCQEIIKLLFYEQEPVPYEELAQRLGLARGSIGFIRGRCLKRLERLLEDAGFLRWTR